MSASMRLSMAGQSIAQRVDDLLSAVAGERIGYVLIFSADDVAQYMSNGDRAEGVAIIESLLDRWKSNQADIPAHDNPDLKLS